MILDKYGYGHFTQVINETTVMHLFQFELFILRNKELYIVFRVKFISLSKCFYKKVQGFHSYFDTLQQRLLTKIEQNFFHETFILLPLLSVEQISRNKLTS